MAIMYVAVSGYPTLLAPARKILFTTAACFRHLFVLIQLVKMHLLFLICLKRRAIHLSKMARSPLTNPNKRAWSATNALRWLWGFPWCVLTYFCWSIYAKVVSHQFVFFCACMHPPILVPTSHLGQLLAVPVVTPPQGAQIWQLEGCWCLRQNWYQQHSLFSGHDVSLTRWWPLVQSRLGLWCDLFAISWWL